MILSSLSQLFIGDNRQPLRQWLSQLKISALVPASSIFSGSSCAALSSGFDNFHTWDCSCEHSPGRTRTLVHTWDCFREHSPGCTRTLGCGGYPSMQQSELSSPFVLWAFFMTSFHSFSSVAFASGINIAWKERSFVCASRFPEACVSERQISRVFRTIRNSRFPKFAEQNNIRSSYFLIPRFSFESILYSPDFQVYLKNFVSQIRCAARQGNMCLLSPSNKLSEEISWDLFTGTNLCAKL